MAARVPPLAALLAFVARTRPERAARRSILDPVVRTATMKSPEAGPLMRALQESVASRIAERLDATLRDVACFNAMPPLDLAGVSMHFWRFTARGIAWCPSRIGPCGKPPSPLPACCGSKMPSNVCLVTHLEAVRGATLAFAEACRDAARVTA